MLMRHLTRCLIAGFVALLPVGGLILTIAWLEHTIAAAWLAEQTFYFPGFGLLAAAVALYLIGLIVTTFIGRWVWTKLDALLGRLPFFGSLYATLKQILGYDTGEGAIFRQVVLVKSTDTGGQQFGLVTEHIGEGDARRTVVYVPGAPNPTGGRLLMLRAEDVLPIDLDVDDAIKSLVSLGKTGLAPIGGRA
jgi:uncharacterized membrane protein